MMNILSKWFRSALVLSAVALSGTAAAGPVILMGIDAEDDNPPFHGGTAPYISVVNSLLGSVTNGGSGLLVVGGGKDVATPDDVTNFWNLVGVGLTESITYVNTAAAISAQDFSAFAGIAVVSDVGNTPGGGLTNDENNALAARNGDIANFVNTGGGLFGLSSEGFTVPYGYVAGLGAFTFTFNPNYDNVAATAAGLLVGITDTNLDVDAWHNTFVTFPSFLDVLATVDVCDPPGGSGIYSCTNIIGNAAAIGGVSVIIVPTPEPTTLLLLGLGLAGLGFAKRRLH